MNIKLNDKRILFLALVLATVLWASFSWANYNSHLKEQQTTQSENFTMAVNTLSLSLQETTGFIYALDAFTQAGLVDGITEESFTTFANVVQSTSSSIKNFSIAPGNVQRFVHPIEGNEATIGHDLNTDSRENVRADVQKVTDERIIVISGPYELRQGGFGMVVRGPIEDSSGQYWGMINIVVDVDSLLAESKLKDHYSDLNLSITAGEDNTFFGNDYLGQKVSDSATISFLTETWRIESHPVTKLEAQELSTFIHTLMISSLLYILILVLIVINLYKNHLLSSNVQNMIYYDELTGIGNRRLLERHMRNHLHNDHNFSLIFIDLDNFKAVNDHYGHDMGDDVLVALAKRLKDLSDDTTSAYRWGGDEFIIITLHHSPHSMAHLKEVIEAPYHVGDSELVLRFSAGVSSYPLDGESLDTLIKAADVTMFHAKANGKDRIEYYEDLSQ